MPDIQEQKRPHQEDMKVVDIKVTVQAVKPSQNPVRDALQSLPGAGNVKVELFTDEGITGFGDCWFGRGVGAPEALAGIINHELKPLVAGTDPTFVRKTHEMLLRETEYHGSSGLTMFGISLIDTALWDCCGKATGVPCWRLWGAVHEKIPAYAMVGWLNYNDEEVVRICRQAVEQGFKGVKIKVGYATLKEDIRRVEIVRKAVGDNVDLMVDANQSLGIKEAIKRGRAFQELGCLWWEEPIPADDIDGYTEIAAALDIPVATGENLYTRHDFARFLRNKAVDIVQPDLRRAGGPTALLQIGMLADSFRIPYASHGGGPVQLNIMACLPNAMYLETGLLSADSPLRLENGCAQLPQGAGFAWE
jgi:L-alanine-DL-glutamate epimerase-like enolase superfamily enzyme